MRTVEKAVSVVLCVILFFATLYTGISVSLKMTVFDKNFYVKNVITDEYIKSLRLYISDIIYKQLLLYETDPQKVSEKITEDELRQLSEENIFSAVNSVLKGVDYEIARYENPDIRAGIEQELQSFAEENDLKVSDGVVDEIYLSVCNTVSFNTAVFSKSMVEKVPDISGYVKIFDYWYLGFVVFVLCISGIIFLNRKRLFSGLYSLFTSIWLGSAVCFIPMAMLSLYDLPSRLSLSDGPMRLFMEATVYGTQNIFLWVFGSVFVFACIGLGLSIFVFVRRHNKEKKASDRYFAEVDEQA